MGMIINQAQPPFANPVQFYLAQVIAVTGTGTAAQITVSSPISGQNLTISNTKQATPQVGDTVAIVGTGISTDIVVGISRLASVSGYLYACDGSNLYQISLTTFTVTNTLPLAGAYSVTVDHNGMFAYVTNGQGGSLGGQKTIYQVNPASLTVNQTVPVTPSQSGGGVVDPSNSYLYVTSSSGLMKFALPSMTLVSTLSTVVGNGTGALAIDPLGQYLYTYNASTTQIVKVALSTFTQVGAVSGGNYAYTIDPSGAYLYSIYSPTQTLYQTNLSTFTNAGSVGSISQTSQMAIDQNGYLYVPVTSGAGGMRFTLPTISSHSSFSGYDSSGEWVFLVDSAGTFGYMLGASGTITKILLSGPTDVTSLKVSSSGLTSGYIF